MIYRSQLTRHEVDSTLPQRGSVDHSREIEHNEIVRRVDRIDPFRKVPAAASPLTVTVVIVGIYVVQIPPTVHF